MKDRTGEGTKSGKNAKCETKTRGYVTYRVCCLKDKFPEEDFMGGRLFESQPHQESAAGLAQSNGATGRIIGCFDQRCRGPLIFWPTKKLEKIKNSGKMGMGVDRCNVAQGNRNFVGRGEGISLRTLTGNKGLGIRGEQSCRGGPA